jgi:hypothetical protein
VVRTFKRDAELSYDYNKVMANGKWNGMMIQKKIGYTIWNDNFPADKLPEVFRIENPETAVGNYISAQALALWLSKPNIITR